MNLESLPGAAQQDLLLATKLRAPLARPDLVPRPRLVAPVAAGLRRKLLLLSAPAGFGKTTLLSTALENCAERVAWVSLDAGDNDPTRFWAYVMAAFNNLHAGIVEDALRLLQLSQSSPIETVLTVLINALASLNEDLSLVLDDYHVIDAEPIHHGLIFLLDHLPTRLHLIISSRADPPLPLARLRAKGELAELRVVDLRFTREEAHMFLNQVMGLTLSPTDVAALEARTEGWIAGLHLAALSLRGHQDVAGFITALSGSHRYILDYLVEEVWERQPERVQHFLLQTSILDRFSGPLCEAVTGEGDGQTLLRQLEQANLFIVPLDDDRRWYRYQHLFADLLSSRLRETQPDGVAELHRRAGAWFAYHGLVPEAVEHMIAGGDVETAMRLIEQAAEPLLLRGEGATLLTWLAALPHDLVRTRPRLGLANAWALVFTNQLAATERLLQEVEHVLEGAAETTDARRMRAEVVAVRAAISSQQRDIGRTIELSRQALEQLPEDNPHRGVLALNLGYAYGASGDVVAARRAFDEAGAVGQAAGNLLVGVIGLTNAGHLELAQGYLHRAAEIYQQALQLATDHGGQTLPITGVTYSCMGALLCEWNDLEAAERYLIEGNERARYLGSVIVDVSGAIRLAQLKAAQGDAPGALDVLRRVEHDLPSSHRSTSGRQLAAFRARLWLRKDNVGAAARWAQEHGLSIDDELSFAREAEHLTLARLLIAQHRFDQAMALLARLQAAAKTGERGTSVIAILVLQTLALAATGQRAEAVMTLARALVLAEPEDYVRVFVDEGAPMLALLEAFLATRPGRIPSAPGVSPAYVRKLMAALGRHGGLSPAPLPAPLIVMMDEPITQSLSTRELEVLHLLAAGHSNQEIAQALIVGVATIKTHINNIYGKLVVRSRTQAVARARELSLLP